MRSLIIGLFLACVCLFAGCEIAYEGDETAPDPSPVVTPEPTPDGSEVVTGDEANNVVVDDVLWLSDKGVLHNSLCRWYCSCAGAEWDGQTECTNCETCGGSKPIVRRWNLEK